MVEELGDQPLFIFYFNLFYILCITILNPFFIIIVITNFSLLVDRFWIRLTESLLDSLGDDLGSSDHNYTIIYLVLDKSMLESY